MSQDEEAEEEYIPTEHEVQLRDPEEVEYWPSGHSRHADEPVL